MRTVCLALLPATVMGCYVNGLYSLWVVLVSVGTAVVTEFLFDKLCHRPDTWKDFSAVVTGLLLALALALVGCSGCGEETVDPDNNKPGDTTVTEGPETGVYYFDAESGEYTIHLHSGNQFTLNDGVARVGTYTVSGETVSFTFTKESNGTATATLAGDVLTLTYGDK